MRRWGALNKGQAMVGRRFPTHFFALALKILTLTVLAAMSTPAQAQTNVDWVVNIDDAGFDPISAGGTIEYVINVDNNGSMVAGATTMDVTIPANTELTSVLGDYTNCRIGATPISLPLAGPVTITCDVPSIPAQTTAANNADGVFSLLTLQAQVHNLIASIPTTGDDDVDNNTRPEETTVREGSDLELTLAVNGTVASGDFLDFDISVLNNGPNTANSFTIEFPIPTGVINITGPGGTALPSGCSINSNVVTCSVTGPVTATSTIVRAFRGQVSAAGGSTITSSASVLNASPNDPISDNNTQTANTTVNDGTDVSVDISRPGSGALFIGEDVLYTVTAAYSGNAPEGLQLETTIPSNFTFNGVSSADGWTCDPLTPARVLVFTRADPATGQGTGVALGSIVIDTTVATAGAVSVSTEISATAPIETNFSNNTDSLAESLQVRTVDLRANKSGPDPRIAVVGSTVEYRISTTNVGTADYAGTIRMFDTLPAGLNVLTATGTGWVCTTGATGGGQSTVTCDRTYTSGAPFAIGDRTPTVTILADVTATATGSLVNTMTVSTPGSSD